MYLELTVWEFMTTDAEVDSWRRSGIRPERTQNAEMTRVRVVCSGLRDVLFVVLFSSKTRVSTTPLWSWTGSSFANALLNKGESFVQYSLDPGD
jgi:hypothetical protein